MNEVRPPTENLVRVAAIIEYHGTRYAGIQKQENGITIQEKIEDMARAFGVEDCVFRASGRTDSGVHARGQVISLYLPKNILSKPIYKAMNWHLPENIRVRKAVPCKEEFDPRSQARLRTYRYFLCSWQPLPPLMDNLMGRYKLRLDEDLMKAAAEVFKGNHDFKAWRSTMCQAKRTELKIKDFRIEPWRDRGPHGEDENTWEIIISCRSFLHRMVRFLVGGIVRVGAGRLTPDELAEHLDNKTLPEKILPAPACGLSLESVYYPDEYNPFLEKNQVIHQDL